MYGGRFPHSSRETSLLLCLANMGGLAPLMSLSDRIERRLVKLGLSERQASIDAGLSETFVKDIRSAKTASPKYESIQRLAAVLKTTAEWLVEGRGAEDLSGDPRQLPVGSFIGAGAVVVPVEQDLPIEYVEVPPGAEGVTQAGIVVGTSQLPVFRPGDILYWGEGSNDASAFLGLECICYLADGRVMLKKVGYGSKPGFYTLSSYNEPDIMDVEITAASPVVWVKRSRSRTS